MQNLRPSFFNTIKFILTIGTMCIAACGTIPDSMKVRDGIAPDNADKDVRFRTTYYFRVYDYCYDAKAQAQLQPVTDSLFRFVMTGKANAYANRVRFESGTLKASDIDPFGATIEQDESTRRLRFVPEAEVQAKARMSAAIKDIEALIDLKKNLVKLNQNPATNQASENGRIVEKSTIDALDTKINQVIGARLNKDQVTVGASSVSVDPQSALNCPTGSEIQRGFQVMGPQGVKTFNQNERLLMAMSSDAAPLLASLTEVSGRYLAAKGEQVAVSDILLPLVRQQLIASKVELKNREFSNSDQVEDLYGSVRSLFNPEDNDE